MTANQNQYHANMEIRRHNLAMERLQDAANLQTSKRDAETARTNLAQEKERARSARANEINTQDYNEYSKAHWARQDSETAKHNRETERLTDQKQTNDFVTANASTDVNRQQAAESRRHNRASEGIQNTQAWLGLLGSLGNAAARVVTKGRK